MGYSFFCHVQKFVGCTFVSGRDSGYEQDLFRFRSSDFCHRMAL